MSARILRKEYITLDTNQHDATLEEAILDYADLAYNSGYKDVQLVFTPLHFMERSNFHIHPDQLQTKPRIGPGDVRLMTRKNRIHLTGFSEFDYDYLSTLSRVFSEHVQPEDQARIPKDVKERVQDAAFALKKARAIRQDPPHDACPPTARDIDPFNYADLDVTAASYGVSGTRKYVHPHMRDEKFNSADYSMIAAFENHLSEIITSPHERQARTIFISNDHMLQDELIKAAQAAGDIRKAELHNRDSMMEYLSGQMVLLQSHLQQSGVALDQSDSEALTRLTATLAVWQQGRPLPEPESPAR